MALIHIGSPARNANASIVFPMGELKDEETSLNILVNHIFASMSTKK